MKNPIYNAWHSLWHNPTHFVAAIIRRVNFLFPDELYLKIIYRLSYHEQLHLDAPVLYNEKLQWIKLYDHNPLYTTMVDKIEAKKLAANIIGNEYIIPTLGVWNTPEEIEWDALPNQFVLKTNHDGGNNGVIICQDKSTLNRAKAIASLRRSLRRNLFASGREWPYKNIQKKIFVETYMEDHLVHELRDYKFYCFDGHVKVMFIVSERQNGEHGKKINYYTRDFEPLNITQGYPISHTLTKPIHYDEMVIIAEKLSKGIPHVRVDLYEVDGHIYFGEWTFFDSGGFEAFEPKEWNKIFGDWIILPKK